MGSFDDLLDNARDTTASSQHGGITQAQFNRVLDHAVKCACLANHINLSVDGAECLEEAGATFELVDGKKVYSATDEQLAAARILLDKRRNRPVA